VTRFLAWGQDQRFKKSKNFIKQPHTSDIKGDLISGLNLKFFYFAQRRAVSFIQREVSLIFPIKHNESRFVGKLIICGALALAYTER
jgi:hypothetical protein